MGPLIFMARRHQVKRKKSNLQYRLLQVQNQRQQIAAQAGQANQNRALKHSLFNVQNGLKRNAEMSKLLSSFQQSNDRFGGTFGLTNGFNYDQAQNSLLGLQNYLSTQSAIDNLISQFGNDSDQLELGQLHMIDSQLEQEQTSLENQLKLLEAEEKAVEQQMDKEIQNSAPKFGLSG